MSARRRSPAGLRELGRPFTVLWAAFAVSNLGDGMRLVAFPLAAAAASGDPFDVALVTFATRVAWIAAPLGGTVADRAGHLRTMVLVNALRAVVVAAVAAAVVTGHASIPVLVAGALLLSAGEVLFDTSAQAVIPALVRDEQLERANARLFGTETALNQFVGLPVGGVLASAALAAPFAVDALSFLAAALLLSGLPSGLFSGWSAAQRQPAGPDPARPSFWQELREGLSWTWHQPVIRTLTVTVGLFGIFSGMFAGPLVLFALRVLGTGSSGYGVLLAIGAAGSVLGAVTASRVAALLGTKPALLVSTVVAGSSYVAFGLSGELLVGGVFLAVNGAAVLLWNVVTVSVRQRVIPAGLRGRVTAVYRMAAWGAMPVGALLGGWLAARYGLRVPPLVAGIGLASCAGVVALLPHHALRGARARSDQAREGG